MSTFLKRSRRVKGQNGKKSVSTLKETEGTFFV